MNALKLTWNTHKYRKETYENFNVSFCCRKSLNLHSLNTTLWDFHYSCSEELSCSNLQKFLSSKWASRLHQCNQSESVWDKPTRVFFIFVYLTLLASSCLGTGASIGPGVIVKFSRIWVMSNYCGDWNLRGGPLINHRQAQVAWLSWTQSSHPKPHHMV